MPSLCRQLKILLMIAIAITAVSFGLSLLASMGTGVFHADTYYLPLREFVAADQQDAMETKVIEIFNDNQRRLACTFMLRDAVYLACLLMARMLVSRLEIRLDSDAQQ